MPLPFLPRCPETSRNQSRSPTTGLPTHASSLRRHDLSEQQDGIADGLDRARKLYGLRCRWLPEIRVYPAAGPKKRCCKIRRRRPGSMSFLPKPFFSRPSNVVAKDGRAADHCQGRQPSRRPASWSVAQPQSVPED